MARACKIKCQQTNFFTCMMNLVVHVLTLSKSRSAPSRQRCGFAQAVADHRVMERTRWQGYASV
ncbi:hypothetical protein SS05631_b57660 (plasmid) [Sinorhizobium sp. CCBAU 05631]|nr:hypothetical protein SS05631_b57660 [Sinorhizobium sp. CCBAU 05631]